MNYILLGKGFEEMEAIAVVDILRRGGVEIRTAGIGGETVESAHGIRMQADVRIENVDPADCELVILPGGLGGVESIMNSPDAISLILDTYHRGQKVAAICAAPMVLGKLGLLKGKQAVIYPGMENEIPDAVCLPDEKAVLDGNVLTGQGPGACIRFALAVLAWLAGNEAAEAVRAQLHYGHC